MKILWINPSFLDYRVPVYADLDRISGGGLHVVYSKVRTPERVDSEIRKAIGDRAVGLEGERSLGMRREDAHFANTGFRIPYQPGLMKRTLEIGADVVIAEGFFQWTPAAIFKCMRQKLPLVISYERTAHTERNCPRWRAWYRRRVVKKASAMACNGQLSRQYASEKLGMSPDRITTGQMVVDVGQFAEASARISAEERQQRRDALGIRGLCYLCVGSITQRKGIRQLLDAWTKCSIKSSDATLLLAGDGDEKTHLEAMAVQRGLTSVRFIGSVPYNELPGLYNAADVFVMPTLEDNWSLVVPEAMACGLPTICSVYNGCWPELIREGSNGWTFDPLDAGQFIAVLERCAQQAKSLSTMGAASRQIISRQTPATAARAILDACEIARASFCMKL